MDQVTPGMEICEGNGAPCQVYQLISSCYGYDMNDGLCLELMCRNISYNGHMFGWQPTTLSIALYQGVKSLKELNVVPLKLHPQEEPIVELTTSRGKKFVNL